VILASVNDSFLVIVLAQAVLYGTPILFAALGELLAERSGVLNLGVEGMMLVGAVMGFWASQRAPGPSWLALLLAVLTAGLAGLAMSAIHAFLCVTLRASQIVSGLALTIFAGGLGLSAYLGNNLGLADQPPKNQFGQIDLFGLQDVPVLGPVLFHQSALVYASIVLTGLVAFYLARTRWGLNVRAVGEAPDAADTMGISVSHYRYAHVLAGGALAGVAGSCFSLSITPGWTSGDSLVGGAGWIAVALVIFSFWRPELCLLGAWLFGGLSGGLPSAIQARDYKAIPIFFRTPEFLNALPYLATIVVLVIIATGWAKRRVGAPAALGVPYVREER
jgi:simple sugar transport system permease protein